MCPIVLDFLELWIILQAILLDPISSCAASELPPVSCFFSSFFSSIFPNGPVGLARCLSTCLLECVFSLIGLPVHIPLFFRVFILGRGLFRIGLA